jgi:hypothetical protein
LPGFARIPEWFDHQNMGHTISFWFRNKLPSMALCFSSKSVAKTRSNCIEIPTLVINGDKYYHRYMSDICSNIMSTHHTYLYDLPNQHLFMKDLILLENDWNHAEVTCEHWNMEPLTEIGIHFFKQQNNMDDIQFTNPYEEIKLNDDDVVADEDDDIDHHSQSFWPITNHPLVQKHR